MDVNALVEAWNYPTLAAAEAGKHLLSQTGIEAEVFGDKIDSMYMTAIGGIRLMVKAGDLAAAKQALTSAVELKEDVIPEGEEIGLDSDFCSVCHSTRIKSRKIRYFEHHFFMVNLLKAAFGYRTAYYCLGCKHTWKK